VQVKCPHCGKQLAWDASAMRFTNDKDANKYVQPPYRAGWSLQDA
jgi:hypothetical protein